MATSYVAENIHFLEKSVGGCTSYDVIALRPDMTRSFFFQKLRKRCLISYTEFQRNPPSGSAAISEKNSWGVASNLTARARVQYL